MTTEPNQDEYDEKENQFEYPEDYEDIYDDE